MPGTFCISLSQFFRLRFHRADQSTLGNAWTNDCARHIPLRGRRRDLYELERNEGAVESDFELNPLHVVLANEEMALAALLQ